MTDIKQCWAFHQDGTRCELPAAHPGEHAVERTWTDEECSVPGTLNKTPVVAPVTQVLQEGASKCVACGHAHKNAECKCGCHSFIG